MTRVAILVVDRVEFFDLAGPLQVFHEAALAGADYRVELVAREPSVRSEQPATFAQLAPLPTDLGPGDIVVVPGSVVFRDVARLRRGGNAELIRWIRSAYEAGAMISSVCVGSFLLGAAGLLDGRTCTTHWRFVDALQRAFPRANVVANRLYTIDDRIVTSAGIASGVDLALAMVERHDGPRVAAAVAREMVVSVRRPGTHEQLSPYFERRDHLASDVHAIQDWLIEDPGRAFSLDDLAARAGMSTRTLTRQFKAATGSTIKEYATALRLEHARSLLRDPALTVDDVAARCGFADGRHLRRLWREAFGVAPSSARGA